MLEGFSYCFCFTLTCALLIGVFPSPRHAPPKAKLVTQRDTHAPHGAQKIFVGASPLRLRGEAGTLRLGRRRERFAICDERAATRRPETRRTRHEHEHEHERTRPARQNRRRKSVSGCRLQFRSVALHCHRSRSAANRRLSVPRRAQPTLSQLRHQTGALVATWFCCEHS